MNLGNPSVLVVDQNALYRNSYAHIISGSKRFAVHGTCASGEDALKHIKRTAPDIVMTDIELPGIDGIEMTRRLKSQLPRTEIIIVSRVEKCETILEAFSAGASGYINKISSSYQLIAALEDLKNGKSPIDGKIARILVDSFHTNQQSPLSRREQQVLTLVARGKTREEISSSLCIAHSTTKTHMRNIYSKLNVNKKSSAVEFAYDHRLITRH